MPSLLDPGAGGSDPTGILSLLGPALSGGVTAPGDSGANLAALLAAGSAMANAGAPTLGPPPTTAQAILSALGAGRQAGMANEILPFVARRAQEQQLLTEQDIASRQLDYNIKQFGFDRAQQIGRMMQGVDATAPANAPVTGSQPSMQAVPPGTGNAGSGSPDMAGLPSFQALPDQTRAPAIQTAMAIGMSPDEAGQWARILMHESNGLQIDPKTGMVTKNPQSSATGVGQLLTDTYGDMANKYGIKGSVTDLLPNLQASAHYFHDLTISNGGNLRNATMGYAIGPGAASNVISGKSPMDADTADYLVKTQAPGAPGVQFAGPGAGPTPSVSAASTASPASGEALVSDPITHAMVPLSVLQAARGAYATEPDVMKAGKAYTDTISDYLQKKALMPTYSPSGTPGVQINSQGQTSAAPQGTVTLSGPTPEQRKAMFPQVPAWQDILLKKDQTGAVVGYELPDMGPEPIKPISDEQAQKPTEQGGAGASYRPQTAYGVGTRTGLVKPIQIERGSGVPVPGQDGTPPPASVTPGQISLQGQQFQQAQAAEDQIVHSPVYTQWSQGQQRYDAVIASLNQHTRAGDQAALESLAKVFDPGAVVNEGKLVMASTYGGLGQQLQNWYGSMTGAEGLPEGVRQQIANLATAEMKTRDAAVMGQISRTRASAAAKGVNPANVMPLFQTTALSAGDPEAKGAPAGVQLAQPYVLQDGQYVRQGSQPTSSVAPAPPAPAASGSPPADVLTAETLGGLNDQGMANVANHIKQYSPADQQRFIAEVERRRLAGHYTK